jgi:hypothetical protein
MFKTAIGTGSAAAVMTVGGMLAWVFGPSPSHPDYLPFAMLALGASLFIGWKITSSTARLLESDGFFRQQR